MEIDSMLLIAFGTRPEYLKIKPVIDLLPDSVPYKILFTGQHTDLISGLSVDHHKIEIPNEILSHENRLDTIVCSILNDDRIFDGITHVLVQGDTTSAFAVAIAAFHRQLTIMHLEAGLRTYNMEHPYPEEFNRQVISSAASVHFCPTKNAVQNLVDEDVSGEKYVTGNTILDALVDVDPTYGDTVLVTMHRRENHDIMDQWFKAIENLALKHMDLKFIIPIHPNPNVKKHAHIFNAVKVVPPMEYEDMISEMAKARLVITDSGGIQEESSFLKKRSIVCRKITERVEGLSDFHFLSETPEELEYIFDMLVTNYKIDMPCPYGDGTASKMIVELIGRYFGDNAERFYR
jgi:UDP-N-acetylglucosamine 2-epimerase (non-hydrolysing)